MTSHPDCSSDYMYGSERSCLENAIPHDPWALFKQLCLVHGTLVCGNNSTRASVPSFVGFLVIKESEPSVFAHNRVFFEAFSE